MIGTRITVQPLTTEEARNKRENQRDVRAFSKCLVTSGVITAAVAGGIYYFGGEDSKPLADQVFKYGGLTTLAGALLPIVYMQASGILISPETEETKARERTGLLHKVIF